MFRFAICIAVLLLSGCEASKSYFPVVDYQCSDGSFGRCSLIDGRNLRHIL